MTHALTTPPPPPPPPPDFSGNSRKLKTISIYAAAMVLGIILFFTLHYIGNSIPYDLAKQRFADEFAVHQTGDGDASRYFRGERPLFDWEFCDISVMVMAGARRGPSGNPLVDAIRLKNFRIKIKPGEAGPAGGIYYCAVLYAASGGAELSESAAKPRYWWGSKAALSILLRFLSVYDIHQLILFATYTAWGLLAASLLLMGWRILLTAAPLIILGALFSDIGYFADITNGLPYLFTLLAASVLALLLLRPRTARWAPRFCFITGMVSAYLWFFDGHTALAMVLIGLIAWLGYARLKRSAPIRRAAACLALYLAAFALCIALGQGVKVAVVEWATDYSGWGIARGFFETVTDRLGRAGGETVAGIAGDETYGVRSCRGCGAAGWQRLPIIRDIRGYWMMLPFGLPAGNLLNAYSALALAAAVAVAIWRARRGQTEFGRGLLWLVALALLASIQFFLPNDLPFRNARFAFLLLAICWMALALAVPRMNRRARTATAATAAVGIAAAIAIAAYWHIDANRVIAQSAQIPPVISDDFDVYHSDGRLTYIKEDCNPVDTRTMFFLHLTPRNTDDLPDERQELGFDNLDFNFQERQRWVLGKCVAAIGLPDYDIAYIHTGQYIYQAGTVWGGKFPLNLTEADLESARAAVAGGIPLARGVFDVYRDGNRLVYLKESCRPADTQHHFYLHLTPQDVTDLPPGRRRHGFDNFDFVFADRGGIFEGQCLAVVGLPGYEIATIKTGQFTPGPKQVWSVEFALDVPKAVLESRRAEYAAAMAGTPLSRGVFDIYRDGNRLTYIKESCRAADTQPRFYLHITPWEVSDLPSGRRGYGFDSVNFELVHQGALFDGKCLATVELPGYNIATIKTGQFTSGGGKVWAVEFALDVPQAVIESRRGEYAAATAGTPLSRGVFDIYRNGNRLTYIKENCRAADTQLRFYLHLIPRNVNDLPAGRRRHGFDNLNFDFLEQGTLFDGKCLATVNLPDYEIATIQTGQYIPGGSRIWQAEFPYR